MKVLHLCLACFYIDNYSYQENMLPKFHKKLGYDVEIIASTVSFDEHGNGCYIEPRTYFNENGIKVTRLPYNKTIPAKLGRTLRIYDGLYSALNNASPDIVFVHGCQFLDIKTLVKYLKLHKAKVFVDNHADFSNSATNWVSKNILHRFIWKKCAWRIEPYTTKFYGVLPARVEFLRNLYKLPSNKCELLVMGADDELVEKAHKSGAREKIRSRYGISENDFLIVTGGKIDRWKTQTLLLMKAVQNIYRQNLRLIVFGSVSEELKEQLEKLTDGSRVQYIGWINSTDTYDYFEAADLVVFPGRHSVMWEQVTGQGKPMIVKDWPGTHHIDLGGNVIYLTKDSVDEIQGKIEFVLNNPDKYSEMAKIAERKGMQFFSYADISKRAIK